MNFIAGKLYRNETYHLHDESQITGWLEQHQRIDAGKVVMLVSFKTYHGMGRALIYDMWWLCKDMKINTTFDEGSLMHRAFDRVGYSTKEAEE